MFLRPTSFPCISPANRIGHCSVIPSLALFLLTCTANAVSLQWGDQPNAIRYLVKVGGQEIQAACTPTSAPGWQPSVDIDLPEGDWQAVVSAIGADGTTVDSEPLTFTVGTTTTPPVDPQPASTPVNGYEVQMSDDLGVWRTLLYVPKDKDHAFLRMRIVPVTITPAPNTP